MSVLQKIQENDVYFLSAVFLLTFLYQTLWVFQGIDLGDAGYHLTNQQEIAYYSSVRGSSALTFLTDYFGSKWLLLIGRPNLLMVRIGGALLNSIHAAIAFLFLSQFFPRKRVFAPVMITAVFINPGTNSMIHYYTLPPIMLSGIVYLVYLVLKWQDSAHRLWGASFFLGMMMCPLALARFPLLVMPLLVLPVFIYAKCAFGWENVKCLKAASCFLIGVLLGYLACFWGLRQTDYLGGYSESLRMFFGMSADKAIFSMADALKLPALYLERVIKSSVIAFLWMFVLFAAGSRLRNHKKWVSFVVVAAIGLMVLFVKTKTALSAEFRFKEVLTIAVAAFLIIRIKKLTDSRPVYAGVLLSAVVCALAVSIGSNIGFSTATNGMWLSLPLFLLELQEQSNLGESTVLAQIVTLHRPILVSIGIIGIIIPLSNLAYTNTNRHNAYGLPSDPAKMTYEFKDSALRGIFVEKEVGEQIDEMLTFLRLKVKKGETIICLNNIGLFHYLTQTRPLYERTLLGSVDNVDRGSLEKIYLNGLRSGKDVKVFVFNKIASDKDLRTAEYLKNRYEKEQGFSACFENKYFEILVKGNGARS